MLQLQQLMLDIERGLDGLERRLSPRTVCGGPDNEHQVVQLEYMLRPWLTAASPGHQCTCIWCGQEPSSCTERRLAKELVEKGIRNYHFTRVPEHYYQKDLEYRRDCLHAASIQHLCKSLLYENPKLPAELECQDFQHCLVIVQVKLALQPHKILHLHPRSILLTANTSRGQCAGSH